MINNDFGELHITSPEGKVEVKPTYCCGHCTGIVVMNPNRTRERVKCYSCQKFLCERNPICMDTCTPMHAMAKDHFEGAGKFGERVNAIMAGCTTVEEGVSKGLILPGNF